MAGNKRTLAAREHVASIVRRNILTGEYHPNQILSLDEVADLAGCSRTPVREAFQMLAAEDLIDLRPNRGAAVKEITEDFILDHYWLRKMLEEEASIRACRSRSKKTPIHLALEDGARAVRSRDVEAFNEANLDFHTAIWAASSSAHLKNVLSQLWNGLSPGAAMPSEDYIVISQLEHEDLWKAIEESDEDAARAAVRRHLDHSRNSVLERIQRARNSHA